MKCMGLKGTQGDHYSSLSLAMFNMAAVTGCDYEAHFKDVSPDGTVHYFCSNCRPSTAKEITR